MARAACIVRFLSTLNHSANPVVSNSNPTQDPNLRTGTNLAISWCGFHSGREDKRIYRRNISRCVTARTAQYKIRGRPVPETFLKCRVGYITSNFADNVCIRTWQKSARRQGTRRPMEHTRPAMIINLHTPVDLRCVRRVDGLGRPRRHHKERLGSSFLTTWIS
ncbi:hypothetical protein F4821DRAFT_35732 [Hypoxylon rubiginosum]|uniref:Uncharacterized protein n=1 Tax=Hypoxylon rubiginosum TaxID=110542 RepID=A0ACC0DBH2_9PEZI|nr:hypothetical protein F4821DRAFT_35732 [Hypoxylon rubiginosum]